MPAAASDEHQLHSLAGWARAGMGTGTARETGTETQSDSDRGPGVRALSSKPRAPRIFDLTRPGPARGRAAGGLQVTLVPCGGPPVIMRVINGARGRPLTRTPGRSCRPWQPPRPVSD